MNPIFFQQKHSKVIRKSSLHLKIERNRVKTVRLDELIGEEISVHAGNQNLPI